jgi:hypothetical protein
MRFWNLALVLLLVVAALVACGGEAAPAADEQENLAQTIESDEGSGGYTSEVLVISYERALPASNQLALGTFRLEGTENAVTPDQAKALLPLWQAIQGGALQSDAETNAVLKQIEGTMTAEQLAAIAALQLTFEEMGTWMQEQGVNFGRPAGAAVGQGALADMSEEERTAMRATRQAGGEGGFGRGGFADMSEEEREALRATAEASGMTFGGRSAGARRGGTAFLAEPLVELLTQRAAE